ncbi:hypothetical protein Y032_0050g1915 [Ancylostoma ceylanicum]|uniref:G-protein coupled receptors family 1 profile domain-containing protein n=1 Tax=Ancylostoma ceylanicum TaxID=53326 RepID=A0A016UA31_9BILA|nr:hypothetical protein Y032_0050g1915 [Ancylostoma ceylanicum]
MDVTVGEYNVAKNIASNGGRTLVTDIIVGSCMILISFACTTAYSFVLAAIWRDDELMRMPTYRFMFILGIFDVLQCIPHFITGIFTICQSVFHPFLAKVQVIYDSKALIFLYKNLANILCKATANLSSKPAKWSNESMKNSATDNCLFWHSAKARKAIRTCQTTCAKYERNILLGTSLSILGTPCYVAYCVITVILSLNRFLVVVSPKYNETLFSAPVVYTWYIIIFLSWLAFAVLLSSPWATLVYSPENYSWTYDFNLPLSSSVQKSAMTLELACVAIFGFFYIYTLIVLYSTRKRFATNSKIRSELKILVQCIVIAVYTAVMNILWHQSQGLPSNLWFMMALNFMWVLNSGVYPIIYFIVNRTIRSRIVSTSKTIVTPSRAQT